MSQRSVKIATAAGALLLGALLAGCTAVPDADALPPRTATASPTSAVPPTTAPPTASAQVSPTSTHPPDPRDDAYRTAVAGWADTIPEGFVWPDSVTGLPAGRWHGVGDWSRYVAAEGIHHCMLVYAAWDAYFVDDDPVTSKAFAARADATMPEQNYPSWVTRDDGTIIDEALAAESGICNGFVGDLRSP